MDFRTMDISGYYDLRRAILEATEGNIVRPYNDSSSLVTIGIGINIEEVSQNLDEVLKLMGFDLSSGSQDEDYIAQIRSIVDQSASNSVLRTQLNAVMASRLAISGEGRSTFTITTAESATLFNIVAGNPLGSNENERGAYEEGIFDWEQEHGLDFTPVSIERAVLFSLSWNNAALLLGDGLGTAVSISDRAEAWYEIRYNSNGGSSPAPGVAPRRYAESEIFGLYSDETGTPTILDSLLAYRMFTKHIAKVEQYEAAWSVNQNEKLDAIEALFGQDLGHVDAISIELKSAFDRLVEDYADLSKLDDETFAGLVASGYTGMLIKLISAPDGIQKIWVAAEKSGGQEYVQDFVDRTGSGDNDLIFGNIFDMPVMGGENPPIHADQLKGGAGSDWIVGGLGADMIDGGVGEDLITYLEPQILEDGSGVLVDLELGVGKRGNAEGDQYAGIENVIGSIGEDTIRGRFSDENEATIADNNVFLGMGGADTLLGGEGKDILFGGQGEDTLFGGNAELIQDRAIDLDTLQTDHTSDELRGGAGFDTYYVQQDSGRFLSDGVASILATVDRIIDSDGQGQVDEWGYYLFPEVVFRPGNYSGGAAYKGTIYDGPTEAFYVYEIGPDWLGVGPSGGEVWFLVPKIISAHLGEQLQETGNATSVSLANYLGLRFADYLNQVTGDAASQTLIATDFDDYIKGFGGNDIINALLGDDIVDGGSGSDTIHGDSGADDIAGGTGNDLLNGDDGDDTLDGGTGQDTLDGGAGADDLAGGDDNDIYVVDNVADRVFEFGTGVDVVQASVTVAALAAGVEDLTLTGAAAIDGTGNQLNNAILGNAAANTLTGGSGLDSLVGNAGADRLLGGDGNDILTGSGGLDTLTGGLGADRFRYQLASHSQAGATRDIITDFSRAQGDLINLSLVDAITGGADNVFTFVGSAAFGAVAGQLRAYVSGTQTIVQADTNGDQLADLEIALTGSYLLTGSDFIL